MQLPVITEKKANELQEATMRRMRWRLWYAFAESKYDDFCYKGNKKRPFYKNITEFCKKHWGKEIGEMTADELREKIAIVTKWKDK